MEKLTKEQLELLIKNEKLEFYFAYPDKDIVYRCDEMPCIISTRTTDNNIMVSPGELATISSDTTYTIEECKQLLLDYHYSSKQKLKRELDGNIEGLVYTEGPL